MTMTRKTLYEYGPLYSIYLQLVFRISSGVVKGFASDGIAKAEVRKPP